MKGLCETTCHRDPDGGRYKFLNHNAIYRLLKKYRP